MRILYFTVCSSALIGLVLLIRTCLRGYLSPGVRYALWLIPMVHLLIPIGVAELPVFGTGAELLSAPYRLLSETVEGLTGQGRDRRTEGMYPDQAVLQEASGAEAVPSGTESGSGEIPSGTEPEHTQDTTLPDVNFAGEAKGGSREGILYLVWLTGSVLLGIYALRSNYRLRRTVLSMEAEEGECALVIRISDRVESPCLFGLFEPCVLMSSRVREDKELYPYVLRHELAHYAQYDHVWTFVRVLLCILYWWHPLVWLGAVCAREDGELACDARVIRDCTAQEKKNYGMSLLRLLTETKTHQSLMCGATAMRGGGKSLRRRMEGIRESAVTRRWVILPVCVLLSAALLFGCQMPAAESYIRVGWNPETPEPGIVYETAFQEELNSKLYYYEVYHYGELMERQIIGYGSLDGDRRSENELYLEMRETDGQEDGVLDLEFVWNGTKVEGGIRLTGCPAQSMAGEVLMNEDGKKVKVQDGDDFALAAVYPIEPGTTGKIHDIDVAKRTEEEKRQILADDYLAVFIRMTVSGLPEEELYDLYAKKCYPAESTETEEPGSISKQSLPEELIQKWAQAMADRDGKAILSMVPEEVRGQLEESMLLSEEGDQVTFGWSSPWILPGEEGYRILEADEQGAELLYYAWDSTPHLYVWRERLGFTLQDGEYQVVSEGLEQLDHIASAEEFKRAYPDGIADTGMDYLTNGMGEALNQNAVERREENAYGELFEAETAACSLLNIAYKDGGDIRLSSEDTAGETMVHVEFGKDGSFTDVRMIQPYGADGIWIPQ